MRKKVGVTLMKLQESGENYLETILILEKRNGIARSVDVATELGFSKPSVSRAVSILKEGGYVTIGNIGQLLLTDKGRQVAQNIYDRHCFIKESWVSARKQRKPTPVVWNMFSVKKPSPV